MAGIEPVISIVTQIEIFSKPNLSKEDITKLNSFAEVAVIYDVDKVIAAKTVEIRQEHKIKLGDAIIAATALHYGLVLITRNVADFNKIKGLDIVNPHNL